MNPLHAKIVLITGASSGIGAQTALQVAELGATVVLVARNELKLKAQVQAIQSKGGIAKYYVCDTGVAQEVQTLAEKVLTEVGVPDVILNNAGVGKWRFIEESSYQDLEDMVKAPLLSALYITKAFLPSLLERNSGQIINATSYAGVMPFSGATGYIATRKAMIGFHEALQYDLIDTKIIVSLSYFATVESSYWHNNPESRERLPKAQKIIPIISEQDASKAIVKGILNKKTRIYTPIHLRILEFFTWLTPPIGYWIMRTTGYRRK